ncbi:MAG TPA: hypothetical protein PLN32_07815 [Methanoregulaceae archaeon]|nr:hypothetical protein [Methanoregulaceae archaeon]
MSCGIKNAGEITCCSFVEEMEFSPAGIIKGVRKCPIRKRQVMGVFQAKDLHEHPDIKRIHGVFAAADLFPMEIPCVFLEYRVKNGSVVGKIPGIPNVFICMLWSRGNFHGDSWLCV